MTTTRGPAEPAAGPRGRPAPAAAPLTHRYAASPPAASPAPDAGRRSLSLPPPGTAARSGTVRPHGAGRPPYARPTGWHRWWAPSLQLATVCGLLVAGSAVIDARHAATAADVAADRGAGASVALAPVRHRVSPPVSISVPRLGIRSSLVDLHKNPDGSLQVPRDYARAGWWADGPRPGDSAPAVVVGHVDSQDGPGVFYRLAELRPGDQVQVRRADGRTVVFVVQRVQSAAKRTFPTAAVYSGRQPALRLITCGGEFDRSTGHYLSNTIVFATPYVAPSHPGHRQDRVSTGEVVRGPRHAPVDLRPVQRSGLLG